MVEPTEDEDEVHRCHWDFPFERGFWRCPTCGSEWFIDHDATKTNFHAEPVEDHRRD